MELILNFVITNSTLLFFHWVLKMMCLRLNIYLNKSNKYFYIPREYLFKRVFVFFSKLYFYPYVATGKMLRHNSSGWQTRLSQRTCAPSHISPCDPHDPLYFYYMTDFCLELYLCNMLHTQTYSNIERCMY